MKKSKHEFTEKERTELGLDKTFKDDPGVDREHPIHKQNLTFLRNTLDAVSDVVEAQFPTTELQNMQKFLADFPLSEQPKKRGEFIQKARKLQYYGVMEFNGRYLVKTPMGHLEYVDEYIKACELSVLTMKKEMNKVVKGELDKISSLGYAKLAIKSLFRRNK